jgi:hypothetical protein
MWPSGGPPQPPLTPHPPGVRPPQPVAYEPVPGTPFGVAIVEVAPRPSGPATASLAAGIASILVSFVVTCFAAIGIQGGWGPVVAGAFAVLAALLGVAGLVLGRVGLRQIRAAAGWRTVTGRGLAIAGMICGGVGLLFTVLAEAISVAVVFGGS